MEQRQTRKDDRQAMKYKGYTITTARPTGGKAGKGCNKTSTVQVFGPGGTTLEKQFRFKVGGTLSFDTAWQKAKDWVDVQPN